MLVQQVQKVPVILSTCITYTNARILYINDHNSFEPNDTFNFWIATKFLKKLVLMKVVKQSHKPEKYSRAS